MCGTLQTSVTLQIAGEDSSCVYDLKQGHLSREKMSSYGTKLPSVCDGTVGKRAQL